MALKIDFVEPAADDSGEETPGSSNGKAKKSPSAPKYTFMDEFDKLENKIREKLDDAYGKPEITIKVTSLLAGLADSIPDMAERAYYKEALIC